MDVMIVCRNCRGRGWTGRVGIYRVLCPLCHGTRILIESYQYQGVIPDSR